MFFFYYYSDCGKLSSVSIGTEITHSPLLRFFFCISGSVLNTLKISALNLTFLSPWDENLIFPNHTDVSGQVRFDFKMSDSISTMVDVFYTLSTGWVLTHSLLLDTNRLPIGLSTFSCRPSVYIYPHSPPLPPNQEAVVTRHILLNTKDETMGAGIERERESAHRRFFPLRHLVFRVTGLELPCQSSSQHLPSGDFNAKTGQVCSLPRSNVEWTTGGREKASASGSRCDVEHSVQRVLLIWVTVTMS